MLPALDLDLLVGERGGEGHRLATRQRMRGRHDDAHVVGAIRERREPGQVARVPAHAEVGGPFAHAADDFGADALLEAHAHRLVLREEAADVVGQEFRQHRQAREHANAAVRAACELGQFGAHPFQRVQHVARLAQQRFARRRRRDAAAAALAAAARRRPSSIAAMRLLIAEGTMASRSAARAMLRSSHTAMNRRRLTGSK